MDITVTKARRKDAPEMLSLQKLAFRDSWEIYAHCTIPPLEQTAEEIADKFDHKVFFKVVVNDKIAGAVRAYRESGTCYPEKLAVHPDFQKQGIGTALMRKVEEYFHDRVDRFRISTDGTDERNIRLYKKLGYKPFKTRHVSDGLTFVYMEKNSTDATSSGEIHG